MADMPPDYTPPDHQLPSNTTDENANYSAQSRGYALQASPEQGEGQTDLAMRMLYEEQTRLRAQVEELKKKGDKGGDDDESEDEDGGDKKGGDKDKKKAKKAPLRQRVVSTVKEHPVGTVVALLLLIVFLIVGILLWRYLSSYEDTDDAFIDGHTDPISARINGHVSAVYVENTYRVKKGQLLVEIDPRDMQVAKEQAAANLAQAQASVREQSPNVPITAINQNTQVVTRNYDVERAQANVTAQEEQYRSSLANLHEAEANEGNAAREEARYRMLVEKEEVSREQYDQRATQRAAQAEVVAARREQSDAAQKNVVQAQAQLQQAKAQAIQAEQDRPKQIQMQKEQLAVRIASAQSALAQANQAELNVEYTKIYAPEDGVIGDKQVQVATQVAPGQELFALTQTNDIWVTANFKETEIQHMHPGQSVVIHVDALNADFNGYVEALPGASGAIYSLLPPENATGNYVKVVQRLPVRIRFWRNQAGAERLAPGMSVEPKVWVK